MMKNARMRMSKGKPNPTITCLFLALAMFTASASKAAQEPPVPTEPPGKVGQPRSMAAPTPLMEPRALELLKRMTNTLATANEFTFHSRSVVEVPAKTGQFVTMTAQADVAMERPNKLRASITGEVPNFNFYYDGKNIAADAPQNKVHSIGPAPDNLDAMLNALEEKTGIRFAMADVIFSNPFAVLASNLTSAFVVGTAPVDGTPCDHLAFMSPGINWEVWVDSAKAVPRRLAITYTDVQNFPRFLVEFSNWNLQPNLAPESFAFKPPPDSKQIDFQGRPPSPTGRTTR